MTRAFVLSGGASLGAIQVGMLQALYERGIAPDLIVGTSVGAINGAFIASREPTLETAQELGEVGRRVRRSDVFPTSVLTGFVGFIGRTDHLVSERSLRRLVSRYVGFDRLEDATIPLHVIAADLLSGGEKRLSQGPAVEAVMASTAIPGVFPAVEWEGHELVDGGVVNNTPISHALELGAEEVYVLPTGYACALDEPPTGALGMLLHAMSLLIQQRLVIEVELLRDRAPLIVLPPPCPLGVQPIDFRHAPQLIDRALTDSRAFLAHVDAGASAVPASMHIERLKPHTHA
jgi:NTE family protein